MWMQSMMTRIILHQGTSVRHTVAMALDHTSKTNLLKRRITSYMIKNMLLWLLAGETPEDIEKHGNVIGARYGVLRQQLHFITNDPKWMTEKDVEKFAEDGRFWAEKIFDAIQFLARAFGKTFGSFLKDDWNELYEAHEVIGLLDTCGRCLERLRPQVFFTEEERALSDKQGGDAGLRTRMQEVINRFNEEAEKVPVGCLRKKRKEVKRLKIKIEELQAEVRKYGDKYSDKTKLERKESECKKLEEEITEILQEHGKTQLEKEERECEELDEEIGKFLGELGHANNKESVLFRIKGEIEELEKKNENDLMGQQPAGERDAELGRKRRECIELEMQVEGLHQANRSHMEKLEKMVTDIFATGSTQDDKLQVPTEESHRGATNVDAKHDDENNTASGDISETYSGHDMPDNPSVPQCGAALVGSMELPGYDPNDVLRGGELAITTMDKYALLCGLQAPSALHLQAMSSDPITSPSESFTAIHYVSNHYVVSCQRNGRIVIYDSLYDDQRIQQVLPQLRYLYQIGSDSSSIEYLVPQSQGITSDCGLFAAANATMLIHGIDPCIRTLDPLLLRSHMDQCLRNGKVKLFPCYAISETHNKDQYKKSEIEELWNVWECEEKESGRRALTHSEMRDSTRGSPEVENNKMKQARTSLLAEERLQVSADMSAVAPNKRKMLSEDEGETAIKHRKTEDDGR